MPRWWGHVNKRLFNPMELRRGKRPVLTHVGRSSGEIYQTPLDAHSVGGGYIFILVYGSAADWVQNILKSGSAVLKVDGFQIELVNPRVIKKADAWAQVDSATKEPPGMLRIDEFLQMDLAG